MISIKIHLKRFTAKRNDTYFFFGFVAVLFGFF